MPTASLKPQGNGTYTGYSVIVGADFAYQAVDDSDGTTHDSASTYFTLPRLFGTGGVVSFPMFLQWQGGMPVSVTINVVARRGGVAHPKIEIGFYRRGALAFDAVLFDPGAGWTLGQMVFATDPISGSAWDPEDLPATEVCLRSESLALGTNDVTLVSGSVVYTEPTNYDPQFPPGVSLL